MDPVVKEYESPYLTFNGRPIIISDPNGDDGSKPGEKRVEMNAADNTGIAPNGDIILMGGKGKKINTISTNLGTEEKADFRITYFNVEGQNGGWFWDNDKKSYLNSKGEEFSNGTATAIFNKVGMGTGTNLSGALQNIIIGEPLKDTRQAYSQYVEANGGSGTWAGFAWNGAWSNLSTWWGDLNAGGNRSRDALIGLWQFTSDASRAGTFTSSSGKTGVFRVQRSGQFLLADEAGNVVYNSMNGKPKTMYMFVGQFQDALAYASKKPGSTITAFTINSKYADLILKLKHAQSMGLKSISASDAHVPGGYFRIGVHSNKIQGFLNWTYKGSARTIIP